MSLLNTSPSAAPRGRITARIGDSLRGRGSGSRETTPLSPSLTAIWLRLKISANLAAKADPAPLQ